MGEHIRMRCPNDWEPERICGLGGYSPDKFNPMVDVECVDRKCAERWIKALRLSSLNGKRLWATHRPRPDFSNGGYLPSWARKKEMSIQKYIEWSLKKGHRLKVCEQGTGKKMKKM